MKLWLDDIREAPEGWVWARCAKGAISALKTGGVVEASLDHDLFFDRCTGQVDHSVMTGFDVVRWMENNNVWPEKNNCSFIESSRKSKNETNN